MFAYFCIILSIWRYNNSLETVFYISFIPYTLVPAWYMLLLKYYINIQKYETGTGVPVGTERGWSYIIAIHDKFCAIPSLPVNDGYRIPLNTVFHRLKVYRTYSLTIYSRCRLDKMCCCSMNGRTFGIRLASRLASRTNCIWE